MSRKEKVALVKRTHKISCDLRDIFLARLFTFYFYATSISRKYFSFLRNYFQPQLLKTIKIQEWYINHRLETNIKTKLKRVTKRDSFS